MMPVNSAYRNEDHVAICRADNNEFREEQLPKKERKKKKGCIFTIRCKTIGQEDIWAIYK